VQDLQTRKDLRIDDVKMYCQLKRSIVWQRSMTQKREEKWVTYMTTERAAHNEWGNDGVASHEGH